MLQLEYMKKYGEFEYRSIYFILNIDSHKEDIITLIIMDKNLEIKIRRYNLKEFNETWHISRTAGYYK